MTWWQVWYSLFCNETATTGSYTYCHTLSLHDALPVVGGQGRRRRRGTTTGAGHRDRDPRADEGSGGSELTTRGALDRHAVGVPLVAIVDARTPVAGPCVERGADAGDASHARHQRPERLFGGTHSGGRPHGRGHGARTDVRVGQRV